ncbi:hypothetical protein NBG84_15760, partial [Streptomyces sp. CWNU-1]|nr:hypothetical protein [Streptomyces sp. CWNU-1]
MTLIGRRVRPARVELGRRLGESGVMAPEWTEVFEAVDRALFLPDVLWPFDMETQTSIRTGLGTSTSRVAPTAGAKSPRSVVGGGGGG